MDISNKSTKKIISIYLISLILGILYLWVTTLAPLRGDDSIFYLDEYFATKDQSLWQLIMFEITDKCYKIFNPHQIARYFPLATMNAIAWRISVINITAYRLVIIFYTYLDIALLTVVVNKLFKNRYLNIGLFALAPLAINIFSMSDTNPMYTYQTITQRTFLYFMISLIALLNYRESKKKIWLLVEFVSMAFSCMVIEVGYMFIVPMGFIVLYLCDGFWDFIRTILPAALGEFVSGVCYIICMTTNGMHGDTALALNVKDIVIAFLQQMSSAFPWNAIIYERYTVDISDMALVDVVPALVLSVIIYYGIKSSEKVGKRVSVYVVLCGLSLLMLPSLLISVCGKFHNGPFLNWEHGWIMSIDSSFGLMMIYILVLNIIYHKIADNSVVTAKRVLAVICMIIAIGSMYNHLATRTRFFSNNRVAYEKLEEYLADGILDDVDTSDLIVFDYAVWGGSQDAYELFFRKSTGKSYTNVVYYEDYVSGDGIELKYKYRKKTQTISKGHIVDNNLGLSDDTVVYIVSEKNVDKLTVRFDKITNGVVEEVEAPLSDYVEVEDISDGVFITLDTADDDYYVDNISIK